MRHPSLSKLQREKCKHLDNFDYHSGYQQALTDVEPLLENAYLAGFFDGEGCIYQNTTLGRTRTYVTVSNNDIGPLESFKDKFGGSICPHPPRCHRWTGTGIAARKMTKELMPFLHIKRKALIEAQDMNFGLIH